jgi:hypothetical protein
MMDTDGIDRRDRCADGCRNRRAEECSNFGSAQQSPEYDGWRDDCADNCGNRRVDDRLVYT